MPKRRVRICVVLLLALALLSTGAMASGASAATACSGLSVNTGHSPGKKAVRLTLIGRVSCVEAHRLVTSWFGKVAAGRCGRANNFCNLQFPGGWDCSFFFAAESREAAGATAGCARVHGGRVDAKIRIYENGAHAARRRA